MHIVGWFCGADNSFLNPQCCIVHAAGRSEGIKKMQPHQPAIVRRYPGAGSISPSPTRRFRRAMERSRSASSSRRSLSAPAPSARAFASATEICRGFVGSLHSPFPFGREHKRSLGRRWMPLWERRWRNTAPDRRALRVPSEGRFTYIKTRQHSVPARTKTPRITMATKIFSICVFAQAANIRVRRSFATTLFQCHWPTRPSAMFMSSKTELSTHSKASNAAPASAPTIR
jgi:hypothetical protein